MAKLRHKYLTISGAMIVAAYLLLLGHASLLLCSDETVVWLGMEDGPIENIGALSFLLASVIFYDRGSFSEAPRTIQSQPF